MKALTPLRGDADHKAALKEAEAFFDLPEEPDPGSEEGRRFKALVDLIAVYERKHYPIDLPDPV